MKTSTPTRFSPRRRLSLHRNLIIEDEFDDLESELQARRQEAINKSTEQRRKSTAAPLLAGLTATQLAQHCKDCIKLSTENKINTKNAFSFMLIDVMAVMAKKSDSEINKNFQVASCTLDASVKIYSYRVDAVHTDVIKMAGGVLGKEMDVEENELREDGNEDDRGELKAKAKKKKKKLTVVNPETLNAKSEAEVLLDIVPRQNFLAMKTDGNDLLIKIPKYNDAGLLLIDSDYPCWPYDENESLVPSYKNKEIFDPEDLMSFLRVIPSTKEEKLCPMYANFEFGKDYDDDSENELSFSQSSNHFEFDVNATVQDVPMSEDEGEVNPRNRLDIPVGGYESGEEIVLSEPFQRKPQKVALADMKKRISINPLEYSMFDQKIFKSWAGPTYWKVRPMSKKQIEENKENEDVSKQVASKRTRKGKAKGPVGLFEVSEDVLVKHLALSKNCTLNKSSMLNWSFVNTTLPKDCKYKTKNLFTLFHIPSIVIETKLQVDDEGELLDDTDEKNDDDNNEVQEELEYCSSLIIRDEGDDVNNEDNNTSYAELSQIKDANGPVDTEAWDQGNMVQVPNRVEKIAVSTFKRKKHVDIKHLKKCIWNILTESNPSGSAEDKITRPVEFSELIRTYPTKMPKALASSLSAPMIFNALLHLTNEKSLVLQQDKTNKVDFVVSL